MPREKPLEYEGEENPKYDISSRFTTILLILFILYTYNSNKNKPRKPALVHVLGNLVLTLDLKYTFLPFIFLAAKQALHPLN